MARVGRASTHPSGICGDSRRLYGAGGLWVRPAKMFFETIERGGKTMKRFELVPCHADMGGGVNG